MDQAKAVMALHAEQTKPVKLGQVPEDPHLRKVANDFEAAFLGEMLRHTGLGKMSETFNGGAGEMQFSGFLTDQYAKEIAASGRLGLADQIYRSLVQRVES